MFGFLRSRSLRRLTVALAAVGLVVVVIPSPSPAAAHAPHDQVTDIEFSPDFATSGLALAVIRGRIMRTTDGGTTWQEVVNGLGGEVQKLRQIEVGMGQTTVAYAVSQNGDLLRSTDGGASWAGIPGPPGASVRRINVSPTNPELVLASSGNFGTVVARTGDGGATWTDPTLEGRPLSLEAAVFHPDGIRVVGVAGGRVVRSEDGGATWAVITSLGADVRVATLHIAPDESIYAGTYEGAMWVSEDGGTTFEPIGTGIAGEQIRSIDSSSRFADDAVLWASTETAGPHRSDDGGRTWMPVTDGLTRSRQADEVKAPHFTTIAVSPDGGLVLLAGFDGLFRLSDDGAGWVEVQTLTGYIAGLAVSPDFATDGTLAVTTYVRGAFISRDGGASFDFANRGLVIEEANEGNRFAPVWRLHNVHFSPDFAEDDTVFSATWVRVLRSSNGGASWEQIRVGTPPEGSPLRQYVLAVSPDYPTSQTIYAATRQGELFRSSSGGEVDTWELLTTFPTRVRSIAVHPGADGGEDAVIFVGTVRALHRSLDSGRTWAETAVRNVAEVTGRETDFGIQVAVSPDFGAEPLVLASTDAGLHRSLDAGATWSKLTGEGLAADSLVEALAVSPDFANDRLLLVSVRGRGLTRSTDGGETFAPTGSELTAANLLIADYANPTSSAIQFSPTYAQDRTIFAYAQDALLRSVDAGSSWERLALPDDAAVLENLESLRAELIASRDAAARLAASRLEVEPERAGVVRASGARPSPAPAPAPDEPESSESSATGLAIAAGMIALALTLASAMIVGRRARSRTIPQP